MFLARPSLLPAAFSLIVGVLAFFSGLSSGVATSIGHLTPNITGAAAAISAEIDGLKGHPYEAYQSVRDAIQQGGLDPSADRNYFPKNFRSYSAITTALKKGESADICGSPLVSVAFNDQGGIEFTQAAFRLFGIDVKSLYYFYFAILGLSAAAYLIAFWRDYVACAALFAAACAVYSFMPGFLFHDDQLMSVSTPRFLSTLGIVPLLHICFSLIRGEMPLRPISIAALVAQAGILSFAYAARSTSSWMVIALILLFSYYFARALIRSLRWKQSAFLRSVINRRGAVLLAALATIITLGSARSLLLMPRCHTELYSHTVWHNIFMGFYWHPQWKQRFGPLYKNTESDTLAFTAAQVYIERHHLPYPSEPHIFQEDPITRDFVPLGSWDKYDELMRSVVIEFIREHPRFALESFLIYRPLTFLRAMKVFVDAVFISVPIGIFMLLVAMGTTIALFKPTYFERQANPIDYPAVLAVLALCFIVSLDSVFVVYSSDFLIADQAYLLVAIVVLLPIWLTSMLLYAMRRHTMISLPESSSA